MVAPRGIAGTEEWKKEEERLVKELSAGAEGDEGSKLVSRALEGTSVEGGTWYRRLVSRMFRKRACSRTTR